MSGHQVPTTISDEQMDDLTRRAQKAAPSLFDPQAVRQRLASQRQQQKAGQS